MEFAEGYLKNHWNMYSLDTQSPIVSDRPQYYIGPATSDHRQSLGDQRQSDIMDSKENTVEQSDDETEGMNFEEYYKSATGSDHGHQLDHKLAISNEQRENLMKRIMILKMQQTNQSQQNETQRSGHTSPKSQFGQ